MMFELLLVFLIIGFSVLFKYSEIIGIDSQLTFILLCFLVVIIYKAMMYYRIKKQLYKSEGFFDFSEEVNAFLAKNDYTKASPDDLIAYKQSISQLSDKVTVMNEYLQELNNIAKGKADNKATSSYDELNIQASQQIQDYRIRQLQKDIEQTTDLIKKAKLRDDAKNFKKIPVYSSCIVSNADGSISQDSPTLVSTNSPSSGSIISNSGLENTINQRIKQSRNFNNSNPVNGTQATSSSSDVSGNKYNMLGQFLEHIQDNGIDINISS